VSVAPVLKVAVNAPLARLFDYLPPRGGGDARPGCRVLVPFGRQRQVGMVMELAAESELARTRLKHAQQLIDAQPILADDDLWLLRFTSDYYHHPIGEVVAAALPALLRQGRPLATESELISLTGTGAEIALPLLARRAKRQAEFLAALAGGPLRAGELDERLAGWRRQRQALIEKGWVRAETVAIDESGVPEPVEAQPGPALSAEQQLAVAGVLANPGFSTTLLDGVTGSGKTEVYLCIIRELLAAGRQVLILVPEIGLTSQFVTRLEERIGQRPLLLHSALTDAERLVAWRSAANGSAPLVLGTRSAVFVPLAAPGLIVVDEEHDASFKQQEGLRYSARDLAVVRGKRLDVPVILGSATPSLETLRRCDEGAYRHLTLTARAGSAVPPLMRLVDLNRFPSPDGLSEPLLQAIRQHTGRGGQALIFLNRRGFAPTLICASCGHIAECRRCDSRMTVHLRDQALACHHCGATRPLDNACSDCGSPCMPLGQGTERIEEALGTHFPGQLITRIDSDTTRLKGAMDRALSLAMSGEAKILVGTQMLSKGHHFPKLTLVGVINADQGLFSTDFRGGERLAQSLVQVAGRAGREREQGEVIVQTSFPGHPFWKELFTGGYHRVARYSMAEREAAGWPPFSRLALLRASSHKRDDAWAFLEDAARESAACNPGGVRVLGPVSATMERRAGRYRGQLLLQSQARQPLHQMLAALTARLESLSSARRVRWSVDVDPIELF